MFSDEALKNYTSFSDDFSKSFVVELSKIVGDKYLEKYKLLYPILTLISYRIYSIYDFNEQVCHLHANDGYPPVKMNFKSFLIKFITMFFKSIIYSILFVVKCFSKSKADYILFSPTFVNSKRIPKVVELAQEKCNSLIILGIYDVAFPTECKGNYFKSLYKKYIKNSDLVFMPKGVTGGKLKNAINDLHKYMYELILENKTFNDDSQKSEELLEKLLIEYSLRLEYVKRKLSKKDIRNFITVNEYNTRDVLVIHALRDLGIKTKQVAHSLTQFSMYNYDENNRISSPCYCKEVCYWSQIDLDFVSKMSNYIDAFQPGVNQKSTCGYLELFYDDIVKLKSSIKTERIVTFMSAYENNFISDEQWEKERILYFNIFDQLKKLSLNQDVKIRIRLNPTDEYDTKKREIEYAKSLGFIVERPTPGTLMHDFFSSIAIVSSFSTVLGTGVVLGRKVYRIEDERIKYIKVDDRINDIALSEIGNITLPSGIEVMDLQKEDFLDIDKMLE